MRPRFFHFPTCAVLLVLLAAQAFAHQQRPGPPGGPGGTQQRPTMPSSGTSGGEATGSVTVFIRDESGSPLRDGLFPKIEIRSSLSGFSTARIPQTTGNGWVFSGLAVGLDYQVEVKLDGYEDARENVTLPNMPGATASVIVFLKPVNQALVFRPPTGQFVLAPKAQKEIHAALEDLRAGKNASAKKHAEKALQLAPGNPYVQYVMGMVLLQANELEQAKPHLEQSVSLDGRQPAALLALGTVRFRQGDDTGAIAVLTKATELDASSWQAEWILANSYLRQRKYEDARNHAQQALNSGKEKAGAVVLVLAQAEEGLGERAKAAAAYEQFASKYSKDRNAPLAARRAADLRREPEHVAVPPANSQGTAHASSDLLLKLATPSPVLDVPPPENWAPPDVDAVKPFIMSGAACDLPVVLKSAEKKAAELVDDLQKFSATEDYEATEIKTRGQVQSPISGTYSYVVLIETPTKRVIQVREWRGDSLMPTRLPGRLQDLGAPGLVLAFHRTFQSDFEWSCEGLGKWKDRPAWVVHFQQRADRPTSLLSSFGTPSQQFALALKGRAWVAQSGGQVLHLETDLMKPLLPVDFRREHFAIDYGPVQFPTHKVELWLPENVDTYIQYQGHFLHYYHHFRNFKLFWVGATQRITPPKDVTTQEE